MTRSEFFALPLLSDHFPIVYPNGARWEAMSGECGSCGTGLPDLRGRVDHPFPKVYVVDGVGLCGRCGRLTGFRYRLHDDMSMTGLDRDGEWARWVPSRPWQVRVRKWLRSLL